MPKKSSDAPPEPRNRLLSLLSPNDLKRIWPRFTPLQLKPKDVLLKPETSIPHVWFVESGIISMIQTMEDGARVEVGVIGREGFVGLPVLLGEKTSFIEAMSQVEGKLLQLAVPAFGTMLNELPALREILLRYAATFYSQVTQTAACNSRHHIEQRLARWLLMTHDRAENDRFTMTQDLMATLLGVRRPSVTVAIGALAHAGFVDQGRGSVTILDREGLEAASCECYAIVRRRYAWLTG